MKLAVSNFSYSNVFQENINKTTYQAREAAKSGCDAIVFHEWFLGINPVSTIPNKVTDRLASIAKDNNIMIITGTIRYMDDNGLMRVGSIIFDQEGKIVDIQSKVNLYNDEKKWLSAGDKLKLIHTNIGNIVVCSGIDGMDNEFILSSIKDYSENIELVVLQSTGIKNEEVELIRENAIEISKKYNCTVVIAGISGRFYEKECLGESIFIQNGIFKYRAESENELLLCFKENIKTDEIEVIDSHVHIVFEKDNDISVSSRVERLIAKSVNIPTSEVILNLMDKAGIDKSVIFDWSGAIKNDFISSNKNVANLAKENDKFIGFGVPSPRNPDFVDTMFELGLNGLKFNPSLQEFYPHNDEFLKVCERANKYNLPIIIHSGPESAGKLRYDLPVYLDDIAVEYPDLNLIIAHIGVRGFTSEQALMVAEKNSNVYVETSWASEDLVKEAINKLGPHKVIFGSDFPTRNPIVEFQKIKKLYESKFIDKQAYKQIVGNNIQRILPGFK